jgi:hypothetical protein
MVTNDELEWKGPYLIDLLKMVTNNELEWHETLSSQPVKNDDK